MEITSHPDNRHLITATWFEIWQSVVFVNAMCIRAGKSGRFKLPSFGTFGIDFPPLWLFEDLLMGWGFGLDAEEEWLEVTVGETSALGNNLTLPLTTE